MGGGREGVKPCFVHNCKASPPPTLLPTLPQLLLSRAGSDKCRLCLPRQAVYSACSCPAFQIRPAHRHPGFSLLLNIKSPAPSGLIHGQDQLVSFPVGAAPACGFGFGVRLSSSSRSQKDALVCHRTLHCRRNVTRASLDPALPDPSLWAALLPLPFPLPSLFPSSLPEELSPHGHSGTPYKELMEQLKPPPLPQRTFPPQKESFSFTRWLSGTSASPW